MVKLVAVAMLVALFLAQGVMAQEAVPKDADPLTEAISRNPGRFEAQIVDLVAGFGGPEGLTLAGIEDHIALERAGARASAMRRFLAMDLDGDGGVTRAELVTVQRAASAATRGRMERQFLGADLDGSDTVDAAEIVADGRAAGLRALDEGEAELLRATLRLDGNGDGALTAAEVQAGVRRLDQES
jgi:hypothetical protein